LTKYCSALTGTTKKTSTYHPCDAYTKVDEVIKALKHRHLQKEVQWGSFAKKCIEGIGHCSITVEEK